MSKLSIGTERSFNLEDLDGMSNREIIINYCMCNLTKTTKNKLIHDQKGYLLDDERALHLAERIVHPYKKPVLAVSRGVIFTTPRCSLNCWYCNSKKHKMPQWQKDQLINLLENLANSGTVHIHWTGGEATTMPGLERFVKFSTTCGMNNSISTNGAAEPEIYSNLMQAGMKRFYISLDTLDTRAFDTITGSQGNCIHVMRTIKHLALMREIHVTVNITLDYLTGRMLMADDYAGLRRLLLWLRDSGVDDFKFLPVSKGKLNSQFIDVCKGSVPQKYLMFHARLETLITSGGQGFHDSESRNCFFCMDDRTYDSIGAYPCTIHLREGGKRLYEHTMSRAKKEESLADFVSENRTNDPLCRRFCFDLYQSLNRKTKDFLPCV